MMHRYDDLKSAQENIDLQSTILSRFDLIFIVKDERSIEKDKLIARCARFFSCILCVLCEFTAVCKCCVGGRWKVGPHSALWPVFPFAVLHHGVQQ